MRPPRAAAQTSWRASSMGAAEDHEPPPPSVPPRSTRAATKTWPTADRASTVTALLPRPAHGDLRDEDRGQAHAYRHVLARFRAHAHALVELQVVPDAR